MSVEYIISESELNSICSKLNINEILDIFETNPIIRKKLVIQKYEDSEIKYKLIEDLINKADKNLISDIIFKLIDDDDLYNIAKICEAGYTLENHMNYVASKGKLEIMKYLCSVGIKTTIYTLNATIKESRLETAEYLINEMKILPTELTINLAFYGNKDFFNYLCAKYNPTLLDNIKSQ